VIGLAMPAFARYRAGAVTASADASLAASGTREGTGPTSSAAQEATPQES
jgi:hypothetical protein